MEEKTITWLAPDEWKILKQIVIISDRQQGEIELGIILYTRRLQENYNFRKQQEEDQTDKDQIDKLLLGYPKQKNYPTDRIDEIILEAIRAKYPKSIVRNDTILLDVDLEKIKALTNRHILKSQIFFSPEFSNIGNVFDYVGKEFRAPQIDISIYSYYRPEFLEGQIFYGHYNVNEEYVTDELKSVHFH